MSFTFSKNDLSDLFGLGLKFSSSDILSKNCFCSLFNSCGVQTLICIKKSPVPYLSILGKPFPFNLKIFPDCVPASILIFTLPVTVSTSLLVPKTASEKFTYKS